MGARSWRPARRAGRNSLAAARAGVWWTPGWPCGQQSRPKRVVRRRRDSRDEATRTNGERDRLQGRSSSEVRVRLRLRRERAARTCARREPLIRARRPAALSSGGGRYTRRSGRSMREGRMTRRRALQSLAARTSARLDAAERRRRAAPERRADGRPRGVQSTSRAHFSAPAKRLRAEHRRPRPYGDLTDSFVPSDGRAVLYRALGHRTWQSGRRKVTHMQTNSRIEPPVSPVPGVVPEPVRVERDAETTPHRPNPARAALSKLLSVLRGDKYMVDAYAPDGQPGAAPHAKER